ncbi:MAG TPA: tetratricopeptide repeat protein [Candidatus Dormibacteraeota bacterium]|nr:tetratricopeptide repeat protein [Candidatus Dormibacteraeota bacterium]
MDSQNLTVWVSAAALLLSLFATGATLVYQRGETERTVRQNLTDVMKKLVEVDSKQIDIMGTMRSPQEMAPILSELNQQRFILAGQAGFLMEQIKPSKVASVEYNQLALLYGLIGNVPQATSFYELSVRKSQKEDAVTQVAALRAFAMFKFAQNEPETARKSLEKARGILTGNLDYELYWRVNVVLSWAQCEAAYTGDMARASELFREAHELNGRIHNPWNRVPLPTALPTPGSPLSPPNAPQLPLAGPMPPPGPPQATPR